MDVGFELLKKYLKTNIFIDFFEGFFENSFHYIEKHANLGIDNLPSYETYDFLLHNMK